MVPVRPGSASGVIELVGDVPLGVEVTVAERGQGDVGERQRGRAFELRPGQRVVDAKLIVVTRLPGVRTVLYEFRTREGAAELAQQIGSEDMRPVDQHHCVVWGNNRLKGRQAGRGGLIVSGPRIAAAQTVLGGQLMV